MLTIPADVRNKLKSQLVADEDYKRLAYTDSRGVLTIGCGRNIQKVGITLDEALYLLDNDIMTIEHDLWKYASSWYGSLDDARKAVVIQMTFQLGIGDVLNFKDMIACLEKKDYEGAAKQMMASSWDNQTPQRCHRLALVMETGVL